MLRRLMMCAAFLGLSVALVGCGTDEIKDPKRPSDAKEFQKKTPGGAGGPAAGAGAGKPGTGSQ